MFCLLGVAAVAPGSPAARAAGRAEDQPRAVTAQAAHPAPKDYTVTLVARQCAIYEQIMANRARNDIQESLKDLGKNSVYGAGQPVNPDIEEPNSPGCRPLLGWHFTFGSGIRKPGMLSVVTGANGAAGPTVENETMLSPNGNVIPGRTVAGAVTYTLTEQQADLASRGSRLWLQGGTVEDPLLAGEFGTGALGFGALRCAIDNLNGDNVEWISYPPGTRHVFCYAYYVHPEPGFGTVTISKQLPPGEDQEQQFTFASNLTYNPSGTFTLTPRNGSAQQTFTRAATADLGEPYVVTEQGPPFGWTFQSLNCTATGPGGGAATSAAEISGRTATIDLSDGDAVTCTYVDAPPRAPDLHIRKVTAGRAGGPFTFDVTPTALTAQINPPGPVTGAGQGPVILTATTSQPETPVEAQQQQQPPVTFSPGSYQVTETVPQVAGGRWAVEQASCDGVETSFRTSGASATIDVTLALNGSADCTFRNVFVPAGHIALNLTTHGGTATGGFVISGLPAPGQPPPADLSQQATTTSPGEPAAATGDSTYGLSLASYLITPTPPETSPAGSWTFQSWQCTPASWQAAPNDSIVVTLSESAPTIECVAVYELTPPVTLQLVKSATGPASARRGPAVLAVTCTDGLTDSLTLASDQAGPVRLRTPLQFLYPTSCTVSEPQTGAAPGAALTVYAALNTTGSQRHSLPLTLAITRDVPVRTVSVTDAYSESHPIGPPQPPQPPGPPAPGPGGAGAGGGTSGRLPFTGLAGLQLVLAASALLAGGVALLRIRRHLARPRP
ncbi:MAG: prealbumin-like fold domain-containing protein [Frankiaceae bacterium]